MTLRWYVDMYAHCTRCQLVCTHTFMLTHNYKHAHTYKQGIKEKLRPYGFKGFMMDDLTPNKTRRAQCEFFWIMGRRGFIFIKQRGCEMG